MGSCCEPNQNDYDLINSSQNKNHTNEYDRKNKITSIDKNIKNGTKNYSINNDLRKTNNDSNPDNQNLFTYNSKKKLKLIIKQSKTLPEGKIIIITPPGILGSQYQDGITIFGDYNINNRVDFVFPKEESNTEQNHAEIKYDKTLDLFQVKSLRGNGCFLKIDRKIVSIFIIIYIIIFINYNFYNFYYIFSY